MVRARILLADDHKDIREKVMQQLEPEFEVVGAVGDGNALLEAASQMKPDVCVVDISMPIMSGIEAATQMKGSGSSVKIIFLTVHEDPDFLQAALDAGALGYVVKSRVASDLCPAIRAALAGRLFVSPCCMFPAQLVSGNNSSNELQS
jgi:DNA-binding NarL/FixJ family response regulator